MWREDTCAFCGLPLDNSQQDHIACAKCASAGHFRCLQLEDPRLIANVRSYAWACLDCRSCEVCGGNDESTMFCDLCDRAYHGNCLDPPLLRPPKGEWHCPRCEPQSGATAQPTASTSRRPSLTNGATSLDRPTTNGLATMNGFHTANGVAPRGKGKGRAVEPQPVGVGDPAASLGPRVKLPSGFFGGLDVEGTVRSRRRRYSDGESLDGVTEVAVVDEEEPENGEATEIADQFGGLLTGRPADLGDRLPTTHDRRLYERARAMVEPKSGHKKKTLAIPRPASTMTLDSPYGSGFSSSASSPGVLHLRARQPHEFDGQTPRREGAISRIRFGQYDIETWYQAPYPEEFARVPDGRLFICEYCLKYMKSSFQASRHRARSAATGDEIYRDGAISVFEVDGRKNRIYCQNLCLFAKMFLDHKTLYYDVDPFLFYVMTRSDAGDDGAHFIGYFSKEKRSPGNNVSCIASLPSLARQGWGNLLISFSYLLSMKEGRIGTPEKPLSDLYRSYWTEHIYRTLLELPSEDITLDDISRRTAITSEEIYYVLKDRHLISTPEEDAAAQQARDGPALTPLAHLAAAKAAKRKRPHEEYGEIEVPKAYRIHFDRADLEAYLHRVDAKGYPKIKPDCLRWSPFVAARQGVVEGSELRTSPARPELDRDAEGEDDLEL